jgi:predicted metalloprotease with PDZ domain
LSGAVRYTVRVPQPSSHLVEVELRAEGVTSGVELVMPSWTPGSYLIREFPRNVQEFAAESGGGQPLRWSRADKNRWRIDAPADGVLVCRYRVYANELTVRTSHVDASHASLNGASVFLLVRGRERSPAEVHVEVPEGWTLACPLPGEREGRLHAGSYAELIDAPIEIGTHAVIPFDVDGVPHRYVVWGSGNLDADRLARDTTAIVRACRTFWGGLPYEHYTFFVHLAHGSGGGLEHRNSTLLHADPHAFSGKEYEEFLALVAHEFFHVWNGTRLRPEPLVEPDLTREAYTRNLWVIEGLTTYYTDLVLRRAGLITEARYLERLAASIERYERLPGRHVQSLADSSFDTWIKFYRQDEHSPNAQISYYHKGALAGLLLDMRIRAATGNRRSLDDVMRLLWTRYAAGEAGFPEDTATGIGAAIQEVAETDLSAELHEYLHGTGDLDFSVLEAAGLEVAPAEKPAADAPANPRVTELREIGVRFDGSSGRVELSTVYADGPGHAAGLNARDEVIAIDGHRVDARTVAARIRGVPAGARMRLTVFRRARLLDVEIERLDAPRKLRLQPLPTASEAQRAVRDGWLGTTAS